MADLGDYHIVRAKVLDRRVAVTRYNAMTRAWSQVNPYIADVLEGIRHYLASSSACERGLEANPILVAAEDVVADQDLRRGYF